MVLQQILDYVNMLEEKGAREAALTYLHKELDGCLAEDILLVDAELLTLPVRFYSTQALLYTLTLTYYYREVLSNRKVFFEAVYGELVFARGLKEAEEALLVLQ